VSWLEEKYINAISPRLTRFTRKNTHTWNLRCPVCGDSQRNKLKARGYILAKDGKYTYMCHNCHASMSLSRFIETIDPTLYAEYRREKFIEQGGTIAPRTSKQTPEDISKFIQPKFIKYTALKTLPKISQLDPEHPAKRYVVQRLIPNKYHAKLFFVRKFREWTNTLIPNKFDLEKGDEPRLIIPLIDDKGNLFGYQGRSFGKTEPRYITIILRDDFPKVYGAESIDTTQPVYVLEGPIDSMFIDNSIAMIGAHLSDAVDTLHIKRDNMIVVYDNEPRNADICRQIGLAADKGYKVCIWPSSIIHKDINEMVLAGMQPKQIQDIIDQHTYTGLHAKMMLLQWKRV
jgi:hypothetical protein